MVECSKSELFVIKSQKEEPQYIFHDKSYTYLVMEKGQNDLKNDVKPCKKGYEIRFFFNDVVQCNTLQLSVSCRIKLT